MFNPFEIKSTDISGWVVDPSLSKTDITPRAIKNVKLSKI